MRPIVCLLLLFLACPGVAREIPLSVGNTLTLHSAGLHEDRQISIYLPEGYEETSARYPVLYLLDAETHLLHAGGSARLLGLLGEMPRVIVVGIANTDRVRDMTPPLIRPDENYPDGGGANRFLSFLQSELAPYVRSHYRTEPFSILAGTSLSGLLVTHAFVTDPDSFDAYVAASPSLWWNEGRSADELIAALEHRAASRPKFLFISLAGGDSDSLQRNARRVFEVLDRRPTDALSSQHAFFDDESHNSSPLRSFYGALKWMYTGWRPATASGLADLRQHYDSLSKRYGYSIPIPDTEINNVAYGLLYSGRKAEAVELFALNTRNSPGSANAWDSLGEGYRVAGNLESSKLAYRKACELGRKSASPHSAEYCANLGSVMRQIQAGLNDISRGRDQRR